MPGDSEQVLTEWLVLQAQSGSSEALEQLLKLCYPKLLRYARAQTRSRDAAKDIVQETMLCVSRQIRRIKDPAAFPKWMYQILQRRTVDYMRTQQRNRRSDDVAADAQPGETNESASGALLADALESLAEESYRVVHLRYLIGLSVKEIASIIDVPEGTVKSRLHSARAQLRIFLTE